MKRQAGYLLLFIFLALSSVIALSLFKKLGEREGGRVVRVEADLAVRGIDLKEMDGERLVWELRADEGRYYRDRGYVELRGVRMRFYSKDGKTYDLSGKEGRYYQGKGDLSLSGDVVGISSDGYRIETDSLLYRAKEGIIETEDMVSIRGKDMKVRGKGLWIDVKRSLFSLKGQVRTSLEGGLE